MKLTVVMLALAGIAAAQDTQLPTCAQGCVNQYTSGTAIAGCSNLDIKCICSNSGFLDGIACCLAAACPKADQDTAVKFAKNICTGAGVSVPDQVVCKNASTSGGVQSGASQTAAPAATSTPNVASSMGPVALLGGIIAALAAF